MIETRLLRNALMLAKHQNFARAAKELHISQPTLTRSIQLLEKTLGDLLFDRTSRTILPTKTGEIVLKHASIIIASARAMQEEVSLHQGLSTGSLFIGAGPYAGTELLAHATSQFSRHYPGIKIEIRIGDWRKLPGRWTQEEFDFLVMETSELDESPDFEITRLNHHQGFFFCRQNHPLLKKDNLAISELQPFPLIGPALPTRLKDLFSRLPVPGGDAGASSIIVPTYTCNDLGTIKTIVRESDAIGIGTFGILEQELESGFFKTLPFCMPALKTDHHIVMRKGLSLSPSAKAFIEFLIIRDNELSILETDLIKSLGPALTG